MLEAAAPCESCPLGATRAVASHGPVPARLLFLSGAPRYHEEHEARAFASPAFPWLEETLARCGLDPATVHYATLTGCRPPHQRPLRAEEIGSCAPRLDRTIDGAAPDIVVLCGPDAVAAMLPGATFSACRGRLEVRGRRRYFAIKHPYAALHHGPYVAEFEEDLRRLSVLLQEHQGPVPGAIFTPAPPTAALSSDNRIAKDELSGPHVEPSAPHVEPIAREQATTTDQPGNVANDAEYAPVKDLHSTLDAVDGTSAAPVAATLSSDVSVGVNVVAPEAATPGTPAAHDREVRNRPGGETLDRPGGETLDEQESEATDVYEGRSGEMDDAPTQLTFF